MLTQDPVRDLKMTGRLVSPTDPDWDETRQVFNLNADVSPAAIALPRNKSEVVAAVEHAKHEGLRVAPQATGHNATAYGDLDGTLLVDVRELQEISIDPDSRSVRVGAGVKWESVTPRLSGHGLAALHGSSPDVGIAGYSLGGGMGWLARKYGLQTNSVTAIEIVTADGHLRRVDESNDPELFWALRGGNGNFGVVTAIEFQAYPVEQLFAGAMFFPFERAGNVIHAWSGLIGELPEEMMTWLKLLQFPEDPAMPEWLQGGSFAVVMAAFLGDEEEGRSLLEPLSDLGPDVDTTAMVSPAALGDLAMDPPDPLPFVSTTAMLDGLPAHSIDEIVKAAGPGSGSPLAMVEFRHLGGAMATPAPGAGARATMPGSIGFFALGVTGDQESVAGVKSYLDALDAIVSPHHVGDYPNFVENPTDASRFFDEVTWDRLRRVKGVFDPGDLFRGNHHIPPVG